MGNLCSERDVCNCMFFDKDSFLRKCDLAVADADDILRTDIPSRMRLLILSAKDRLLNSKYHYENM